MASPHEEQPPTSRSPEKEAAGEGGAMTLEDSRLTLAQRQKLEQRRARHASMKLKISELASNLSKEKAEKQELAARTNNLREEIAKLQQASSALTEERTRFQMFVERNVKQHEKRHEELGQAGMLTFSQRDRGDSQKHTTAPGRHLRRTAFCTAYSGEPILTPGTSEAMEIKKRQTRIDTRLDERSRSETVASPTVQPNAPAAGRRSKALSPLQEMNYLGKPSVMDLESYRMKSLRRTRHYFDYSGKMISMDPCDWPSQDGFVLTGM